MLRNELQNVRRGACASIGSVAFFMIALVQNVSSYGLSPMHVSLMAVALLPLGVLLYRWIGFTCPRCQQRFFFPAMNRSRRYIPAIFRCECANCHVELAP